MQYVSLTHFAQVVLARMPPAHVDDLCNALAGMEFTERKEFVNAMVGRAPEPMIPPKAPTPIEVWWLQKLETGKLLSARPEEGWLRMPSVRELTEDYIAEVKRFNVSYRGNATAMGGFLKSIMPNLKTTSRRPEAPTQRIGRPKRIRHYEMPTLDNARRFWEDVYGPRKWHQA